MAAKAMKVAVLEGDFVALCNLGLPFSVSYQLQEKGLKLPDALWTVRASTSGFSVSLYWPNNCESLKKQKRRGKRTKAKSPAKYKQIEQADNEILSKELLEKRASRRSLPDTPTRAHHHEPAIGTMTQHALLSQSESKSNSNSTDGDPSSPTSESDESNDVDLTTCSNVNYESRNGLPGVCYKDLGTTSSWTPVVGRRKKRPQLPPHILRRFPPDHPLRQPGRPNLGPESSSEEDEELVIPQNADVYFNVVKGIPGLQIRTRNTSRWTPVASRTRSKSKSNKVT